MTVWDQDREVVEGEEWRESVSLLIPKVQQV